MRLFLLAKFDLNPQSGQTPLHRAVVKRQHAMVDLLIKSGASAKNPGKYNGETEPLEIATSYCDEPVVQMLVAAGADINAWTATRFSPLAIAKYHAKNTSYKRYEIAKFLEEKRAVCEAPKVLDFKSGTFNASSVVN